MKDNQPITASKRNSPAAGATQGYIRLLAKRYGQVKKTTSQCKDKISTMLF